MAKITININAGQDAPLINVGASPNDKTGDPLRTAFGKLNTAIDNIDSNFTELYNLAGADVQIPTQTGHSGKYLTTNGTTLSWGVINTTTNQLVNNNLTVELNSAGIITLPYSSYLESTDTNLKIGAQGTVTIRSNAESNLTTKEWVYGADGSLTLPGAGTIINASGSTTTGTIYTFTNDGVSTPGIDNDTAVYLESNADSPSIQAGWIITFADATQKTVISNDIGMPPHAAQRMLTFSGAVTKTGSEVWPLTVQSADYSTGTTADLTLTPDGNTSWTFKNNGELTLPSNGTVKQNNSWTKTKYSSISMNGGAPYSNVIWTSSTDYISSAKLVIQVEMSIVGDNTGWHSQACEAIIASRGYANGQNGYGEPVMSVYGSVYTSTTPLVTFSVQRNPLTKFIEVVGTIDTDPNGSANIRIHSVEMSTTD